MSNQSSAILTCRQRMTERHVRRKCFAPTSFFFVAASDNFSLWLNRFFISEPNDGNIIRQLFCAGESLSLAEWIASRSDSCEKIIHTTADCASGHVER